MIAIIDNSAGNLGAVRNMLSKNGIASTITDDLEIIEKASKLILPGVGAFDQGMKNLEKSGLLPVLNRRVLEHKVPILGICLGMQLFCRASEEGELPGLGWIDAEVVRFSFPEKEGKQPKIPHMGWNTINFKSHSRLFESYEELPRFYFVHSYHVICDSENTSVATAFHGYEVTVSVEKDNIFGVQFHPEKSHKYGIQLFRNFVEM